MKKVYTGSIYGGLYFLQERVQNVVKIHIGDFALDCLAFGEAIDTKPTFFFLGLRECGTLRLEMPMGEGEYTAFDAWASLILEGYFIAICGYEIAIAEVTHEEMQDKRELQLVTWQRFLAERTA